MTAASLVDCAACHARNRAHRGYCRACGADLQPVCRGCRFVNERGDSYCGGCGSTLGGERAGERLVAPSGARAERGGGAGRAAVGGGPAGELGELAELLQPLAEAPRSGELPTSGITQDDLDRLFGGPA